jgi:5-methyltetrahydrofolate--homocysteine methyltransferase
VAAAHEVDPEIPVIATLSFDTNLRTMMGVKPGVAVKTLAALGVRVIGANCGRGTDEMLVIAKEMADARSEGTFLITQSNAGLPKLIDGEFKYTGTPEEMGVFAQQMRDLGINIVGSCCGSTPEHTRAIRAALA